MEITEDLIKTIYKRVEQVFIAKMNNKPDDLFIEDGYFRGSYSYSIAYGGQETESCSIDPTELTKDLDNIVKEREEKERIEREKQDKKNKIRWAEEEKRRKALRKIEYEKLKKEFEN